MYRWTSWHTLTPLIIGALGLLAWLAYEWLVPASPIVPLAILGNRTAVAAFTGTLILGVIQFGLLCTFTVDYTPV